MRTFPNARASRMPSGQAHVRNRSQETTPDPKAVGVGCCKNKDHVLVMIFIGE